MVYAEIIGTIVLALPIYRYMDYAIALCLRVCARFARAFASLVIAAAIVAFVHGVRG